ncbi:hypothetical protein [Butyrivibrio sp. M55]|uniref:hypothetical protein n=1 Tax=Butyrivibrio sp. M55 TaxID=1855323 RepID=UPI0008EE3E55|nr:hypothetical protein [Butyrivibrio sp. M55]SFU72181.1 hypothetical protein SAMN05216540_10755 [Butyrivibrio sp. M55]
MGNVMIVSLHIFLATVCLLSMYKAARRLVAKRADKEEHIDDVYEYAGFVIAVIMVLMYIALIFMGAYGITSACPLACAAMCVNNQRLNNRNEV